jgi:hypothetical protein
MYLRVPLQRYNNLGLGMLGSQSIKFEGVFLHGSSSFNRTFIIRTSGLYGYGQNIAYPKDFSKRKTI